ncbi:hypothetical protein MHBO_004494 [Bonamia ostreae]|uniref:Glutamate--tRNA ligase n=1 Tax=Bonamia ostreae TaxID=126728 RepID=A0ABV2ATJ8_9EUKA
MPKVKTFSRVNFVNTVLSKRLLNTFVQERTVTGWDDPRFPTVRGILRRGLTVSALRDLIMELGFSLNENLMEWDRLWSINKRVLDPVAPRFTAIESDRKFLIEIFADAHKIEQNGNFLDGICVRSVPLHPKKAGGEKKVIRIGRRVFVERIDAENLKKGEEITLIEWGNVQIDEIDLDKNRNFVVLKKHFFLFF